MHTEALQPSSSRNMPCTLMPYTLHPTHESTAQSSLPSLPQALNTDLLKVQQVMTERIDVLNEQVGPSGEGAAQGGA